MHAERSIEQLRTLRPQVVPRTQTASTVVYDLVASGAAVYPGFFAGDFMNFGYWFRHTANRREASETLMEQLMAHLPHRSGRVLDVACGLGCTTSYLTRYWDVGLITGINISDAQLAVCRRNVPQVNFECVDAARMDYSTGSFDQIICVEAAFHFETREEFLRRAVRVLKPGGVLALTDLLLHRDGHALLPQWLEVNFVPSVSAYESLLYHCGFSRVQVVDITEHGLRSYLRYMFAKVHDDWLSGRCDFAGADAALTILYRIAAAHRHNLLAIGWT